MPARPRTRPTPSSKPQRGARPAVVDPDAMHRWIENLIWLALFLIATLVVYAPGLNAPLIFDDEYTLMDNTPIRSDQGSIAAAWQAAFGEVPSTLTHRPLTAFTFAMNYRSWRLDPFGYHAINLLIHLVSGIVLWDLVRVSWILWRKTSGVAVDSGLRREATRWAGAVAILWLVHPLQTEAVEYVTQRTTLLCGFFILLTLDATARSWRSRFPRLWQTVAVASTFAALSSKEIAVGLPLLVIAYDAIFVARSWTAAWTRRWGMYLGMFSSWLWLVIMLLIGAHNTTIGWEAAEKQGYGTWEYLLTQALALGKYVTLSFWPYPLTLVYSLQPVRSLSEVWLQGLGIVAALMTTVWGLWQRRWWSWLGACFFVILAPTSSVLPIVTELIAERCMYLPLLAIVVPVVVGLWWLGSRITQQMSGTRVAVATVQVVAVAIVCIALTVVAQRRVATYQTDLKIWTDTVEKTPNNLYARNNLGRSYADLGQLDQAIEQYEAALKIDPNSADAHANLSTAYHQLGKNDLAIEHGMLAIQNTNIPRAAMHTNLALALSAVGRFDEATDHCVRARRIAPWFAPGYNIQGVVYAQQKQYAEADKWFLQALQYDPRDVHIYFNLAVAHEHRSRGLDGTVDRAQLLQAVQYLRIAAQMYPAMAEVHRRLGFMYGRLQDLNSALAEYELAVKLEPGDVQSARNAEEIRNHLQRAAGS